MTRILVGIIVGFLTLIWWTLAPVLIAVTLGIFLLKPVPPRDARAPRSYS
jgi:hypothetical protein